MTAIWLFLAGIYVWFIVANFNEYKVKTKALCNDGESEAFVWFLIALYLILWPAFMLGAICRLIKRRIQNA